MNTTTRNFVLGIVSIGAAAGIVVLLFFFGELDSIVTPRYQLVINARNAVGLRGGSPIELNGVPVGFVDRIESTTDPQLPVRIVALIREEVQMPSNVRPYAAASLLGGSATLQFEWPDLAADTFLPIDGSAEIFEPIRNRMMEGLTDELDGRLAPLLASMEEFEALARNLNELLGPDGGPNGNIRTAVEKLNTLIADVQETFVLAQEWLGDEQIKTDTRTAIANARIFIEKGTETLDRITRFADSLEGNAAVITAEFTDVMDEAAVTLEEIRSLTRRAGEGEGTVAQLLNNPDLYRSLDDAAVRLERTLREMELLVQKVKAEGIPVLWP